jgi:hypothetical protein
MYILFKIVITTDKKEFINNLLENIKLFRKFIDSRDHLSYFEKDSAKKILKIDLLINLIDAICDKECEIDEMLFLQLFNKESLRTLVNYIEKIIEYSNIDMYATYHICKKIINEKIEHSYFLKKFQVSQIIIRDPNYSKVTKNALNIVTSIFKSLDKYDVLFKQFYKLTDNYIPSLISGNKVLLSIPINTDNIIDEILTYLPSIFIVKTYELQMLWNFNKCTNTLMINVVSLKNFNEFDENLWTASFVLLLIEQVTMSKLMHFNYEYPDIQVEGVQIFNKVKWLNFSK